MKNYRSSSPDELVECVEAEGGEEMEACGRVSLVLCSVISFSKTIFLSLTLFLLLSVPGCSVLLEKCVLFRRPARPPTDLPLFLHSAIEHQKLDHKLYCFKPSW